MFNELLFLKCLKATYRLIQALYVGSPLPMNFSFMPRRLRTFRTLEFWGMENSRGTQQNEFHHEIVPCCRAVQANHAVCPYFFNIGTVRGVNNFQSLDT